jgi:hypothetical protein
MTYDLPQATPMIVTLNVSWLRVSNLEWPDRLIAPPQVRIEGYRNSFANWCNRLVAPAGLFTVGTRTTLRDLGQ